MALYAPVIYVGGGIEMITLPQNLAVAAGTLIEGFESASGWTVVSGNTPTDDSSDKIEGTNSMRLDTTGAASTVLEKTVSWPLSGWGDTIEFWYKVETATPSISDYADVYLSANTGLTKYFGSFANPLYANAWTQIRVNKADWTVVGGMTWADTVVKIRIRQWNSAARNPVVHFDGLRHSVSGAPAILFTWDDCHNSIYTLGLPVFNAHNARATVFHVGNELNTATRFTTAQALAIAAAGWINANHGEAHPHYNVLTQAQIETDLAGGESDMTAIGIGLHAPHYAAYPYGEWDADVQAAMTARAYRSGRMIYGSPAPSHKRFTMAWVDSLGWYKIPSDILQASVTLAAAKTMVDNVAKYGQVLCFYAHELTAGTPTGTQWKDADLNELLAYMATQNVTAITIDDLHSLRSAPITIPKTI